jgi:hypothetical protein
MQPSYRSNPRHAWLPAIGRSGRDASFAIEVVPGDPQSDDELRDQQDQPEPPLCESRQSRAQRNDKIGIEP